MAKQKTPDTSSFSGVQRERLCSLLEADEDWLMQRILFYAKKFDYTKYTSTLQEAWRLSISGLTASLCGAIRIFDEIPEFGPDEDFSSDPVSAFGVIEAQRHRRRGITLGMFLGLMKYYRQSYLDLLTEKGTGPAEQQFIHRCFDRIEVAFCQEWANTGAAEAMAELQAANRTMTNEKNVYLTAFESLSDPVVILDPAGRIVNLNLAAARLIDPAHVPGGHYYQAGGGPGDSLPYGKRVLDTACVGCSVTEIIPWLVPTLDMLAGRESDTAECRADVGGTACFFDVKRSDMLDVSDKFTASIIILRDVTKRKNAEEELRSAVARLGQALSEVKKLSGLLPICASCKKVRDDKGYWSQVEEYVSQHSEAKFSHGICPDCLQQLYPEISVALAEEQNGLPE